MTNGSVNSSDVSQICEMFAEHFSSVYSTRGDELSDTEYMSENLRVLDQNSLCLSCPLIEQRCVQKKLKHINTRKGAGPDGVHPVFIANCFSELAQPLTLIYNKSLKTGVFPQKWKMAKVVPVYKSDDSTAISNYRPISILSAFAKIFEALLSPYFQKHLRLYLSDNQHGFVSRRSTNTNLVPFTELLIHAIDQGHQADVIYTDFSKAFDKVSHKVLINKLRAYGISGSLLGWISSYLMFRVFSVVVNGYQSDLQTVSSGVPQGSLLGPILFNFFINDIPECFKFSEVFMYADDLKFVKIVESDRDARNLQSDLNRLILWCKSNGMLLNAKKCYHVKFTRKTQALSHAYYVDSHEISEVENVKDLGVTFDKKMTFVPHLDNVIKRSSKMLGFMLRNSKGFRDNRTKILLYNSLVRSIIEYCSVVWRPHYANQALRLERCQKRFVWHLAFLNGIAKKIRSYKCRLERFNMKTLQHRTRINEAMFASKILQHQIDCPRLLALIRFNVPSRIPRKPITPLCPPLRKTVLGANSPCARLSRVVNSLSDSIDFHFDSEPTKKRILSNIISIV